MAERAKDDRPVLSKGMRWVSAAAAVAVFLAGAAYLLVPRDVRVVAPQCAGGAECAVWVSVVPDSAVIIALLAIMALFAIMALTALPFSVMLGNGIGITPLPVAQAKDVKAVPDDAKPVNPDADAPSDSRVGREASLELWNEIPAQLQEALAEWAADEYGMSLTEVQTSLVGVRRKEGRGNHPYYVSLMERDSGDERIVKLSRGGRGKDGPSVGRG